jgi:hypothetical protein
MATEGDEAGGAEEGQTAAAEGTGERARRYLAPDAFSRSRKYIFFFRIFILLLKSY